MSGVEQRSEGGRLWRSLTRALVFAGTAAAGTSAAWLLGAGLATAETGTLDGAESPAGVSEAVTPERGRIVGEVTDRVAEFDLEELDAAELVADAEAMTRTVVTGLETDGSDVVPPPVVDPVRGVVHEAEPVLEPVRKVTDEVLSLDRNTLPETVETGLGSVEHLVSGTSEVPPSTSPPQDGPDPAPAREAHENTAAGPHEVPPVPHVNTVPTEPVPASTLDNRATSSTASRVVESDRDVSDGAAVPSAPRPLPLPWHPLVPAAPSPPACGCTGDGHGSGGVGLGWLFGAAFLSEPRSGLVARRSAPVPTGGPKPQPGTTPD